MGLPVEFPSVKFGAAVAHRAALLARCELWLSLATLNGVRKALICCGEGSYGEPTVMMGSHNNRVEGVACASETEKNKAIQLSVKHFQQQLPGAKFVSVPDPKKAPAKRKDTATGGATGGKSKTQKTGTGTAAATGSN